MLKTNSIIPLPILGSEGGVPEMDIASLSMSFGINDIGRSMYSNAAFGDATKSIEASLRNLQSPEPPSRYSEPITRSVSVEEMLFDARASAKTLTGIVAMHLDPDWRKRLFAQLDALHDPAEWEKGDVPLQKSSFNTFLRTICFVQPKRRPGLGLSADGHLIAFWMTGSNRLTVEFLPRDNIKIVLSNNLGHDIERAAIMTKAEHILLKLAPYQPAQWFGQ